MFFNVHGFFLKKWSAVKGLTRILNSFTEALSTCPRLPKYIVVVPDKDLIRDINYFGFRASEFFSASVIRLATEWKTKLKDVPCSYLRRNPELDSPKIIWVRVIKHPYNGMQEFSHVMTLHNRFDNAMENMLASAKNITHYVLSIKVDEQDFYPVGDLTDSGEHSFWHEIDTCIHRFDRDEINLNPHKCIDCTHQWDNNNTNHQHRLPTLLDKYRR